jgi:hypothetical protein
MWDGGARGERGRAAMWDGETSDSIASDSGRRSRRRGHALMPPLVPDREDGKTVIKPTDDE